MASSVKASPRPQVACKHPSCGCLFQKKEFMRQHYLDVHDSPAQMKKRGPELAQKEKSSVCGQCGKAFENISSLIQHSAAAHLIELLGGLNISTGGHREPQTGAKFDSNCTPREAPSTTVDVACNDCGKTFRSLDFLHQHQWDSVDHTRVSRSRMPINPATRECSQCSSKLRDAIELEKHFIDSHSLSEVPRDEEAQTWYQIAMRFHLAWKHPEKKNPDIYKVFKVYNLGWRRIGFEKYRKELKLAMVGLKDEENEGLIRKVLDNGNELLRFHGTRIKCELAENSSQPLCPDSDCNLCRILESGFKTSKCRADYFQRFGTGIYVSATSSKADDYAKCSQGAGKKVLLVCRVLAGRVHRSVHNLKNLTSPPDGFNSVQGDPGPVLNYDELVVYDDRAILPAYILLYSGN